MEEYLQEFEKKSIFILREVKATFKKPAVLWSTGKDSTLTLFLLKRAFYGIVPFPVIHIDTSRQPKEIYEFRDKVAREWNLDLKVIKSPYFGQISPFTHSKLECCSKLKTEALKLAIKTLKLDGVIVAIRRDEHGVRSKERYISPRDRHFRWKYTSQPVELVGWSIVFTDFKGADHLRIHPILHWTVLDVWEYVRENNLPVNPLSVSYTHLTLPTKA